MLSGKEGKGGPGPPPRLYSQTLHFVHPKTPIKRKKEDERFVGSHEGGGSVLSRQADLRSWSVECRAELRRGRSIGLERLSLLKFPTVDRGRGRRPGR